MLRARWIDAPRQQPVALSELRGERDAVAGATGQLRREAGRCRRDALEVAEVDDDLVGPEEGGGVVPHLQRLGTDLLCDGDDGAERRRHRIRERADVELEAIRARAGRGRDPTAPEEPAVVRRLEWDRSPRTPKPARERPLAFATQETLDRSSRRQAGRPAWRRRQAAVEVQARGDAQGVIDAQLLGIAQRCLGQTSRLGRRGGRRGGVEDDVTRAAAGDEFARVGLDLQHQAREADLVGTEVSRQTRRFPQRLEQERRLVVDDLHRAVLVAQRAVQRRIVRERAEPDPLLFGQAEERNERQPRISAELRLGQPDPRPRSRRGRGLHGRVHFCSPCSRLSSSSRR